MATIYYWDGTKWAPTTGVAGPAGPAGPTGKDGASVEVFGPQPSPPAPTRKGDIWLDSSVSTSNKDDVYPTLPEDPAPIVVQLTP